MKQIISAVFIVAVLVVVSCDDGKNRDWRGAIPDDERGATPSWQQQQWASGDHTFNPNSPSPWFHGAGWDGLTGHGTVIVDEDNESELTVRLDADDYPDTLCGTEDWHASRIWYLPEDWDQYRVDHPRAYEILKEFRSHKEDTPHDSES